MAEQFGPRGGYRYRESAGKSPWEKDESMKVYVLKTDVTVVGKDGKVRVWLEKGPAQRSCNQYNEKLKEIGATAIVQVVEIDVTPSQIEARISDHLARSAAGFPPTAIDKELGLV